MNNDNETLDTTASILGGIEVQFVGSPGRQRFFLTEDRPGAPDLTGQAQVSLSLRETMLLLSYLYERHDILYKLSQQAEQE